MSSTWFAGRAVRRLGALAVVTAVAAAGLGVGVTSASAAPAHSAAPSAVAEPHGWPGGITGNGVRLRTGPGTGYGVEGLLYYGDTVQPVGCSGSWYHVYLTANSAGGLPAGTWGWVNDAYIDPITGAPSSDCS
ncbi:SH3 domain-containing protein [Streptantibioticus ferralitis]|uniref:SH3 domain-containing protein n=1 Tax=Streptantibioticus ferralitis TaxID=236510 RepID=UPI003389163C